MINKGITLQIFENVAWKTVRAYIANAYTTTLSEIILQFLSFADIIRNCVVRNGSLEVWQSTDFTTVF